MAMWLALSTANETAHRAETHATPWGFDLIPALILTAAVVVSLEIFDHTRVSRPLAASALAALWVLVADEHLQAASLLAAAVCHGVHEAYGEWTPCVVERDMAPRRRRLGTRFWLRVFVWAATLATATRLAHASRAPGAAVGVALALAVYCECAERLLVLYFSDAPGARRPRVVGDWRRRMPLWATSLVVGVLHATHTLAVWAQWLSRWCAGPVALAVGLLAATAISVWVEWPVVVASAQRQAHALVAFVRSKTTRTTRVRTGQRRSFLYRAGSDVEVVGAAMHYDARLSPQAPRGRDLRSAKKERRRPHL